MAALFLKTVPDQTGKVVVLTGGNSGIGLETCAMLAAKGAKVVFTARSQAKADQAKLDIVNRAKQYTPQFDDESMVIPTLLDVSNMEDVKSYRSQLESAIGTGVGIDVLILNAGTISTAKRQETNEGFELTMATNCYGHYVLTCQLFDLLKLTQTPSRVVTLSSISQLVNAGPSLEDLDYTKVAHSADIMYGGSKVSNLWFANKLARLLKENKLEDKILSVACHPGITNTPLAARARSDGRLYYLSQSPAMGAAPTVLAATDENAKQGGYAGPRHLIKGTPTWNCRMSRVSKNIPKQDQYWQALEKKTGCKMDFL